MVEEERIKRQSTKGGEGSLYPDVSALPGSSLNDWLPSTGVLGRRTLVSSATGLAASSSSTGVFREPGTPPTCQNPTSLAGAPGAHGNPGDPQWANNVAVVGIWPALGRQGAAQSEHGCRGPAVGQAHGSPLLCRGLARSPLLIVCSALAHGKLTTYRLLIPTPTVYVCSPPA